MDAIVSSLTGKDIRVFLVGTAPDRVPDSREASRAWRSITEATGGLMVWGDLSKKESAGEMTRMTQEMLVRITSAYRLELSLLRAVDKFRDWQLQATDSAGRALRSVRVVYPHRFAPLANQ
jgi:hypothetical protein